PLARGATARGLGADAERELIMRAPMLPPLLLAFACLVGAPAAGLAQTSPQIPGQSAPIPAAANAQVQPLTWSALSAGQRNMLTPVQDQWDRLRPARQQRLAEHANRWAALPPQRQQQIRERLARWARMTPEQRHQLRANARAFHDLTPAERAKVSAAFHKFQSLPPAERKVLRQRWRAMSPDERKRWATEHPDRPIPARPAPRRDH
ncbi:MAG: DUF3106 domain-containing protein, partial [Rhodanobacteraceae bacterium]